MEPVNKVNTATLREQINFMDLEHSECKRVYQHLILEFGHERSINFSEFQSRMSITADILQSLHELKNLKT